MAFDTDNFAKDDSSDVVDSLPAKSGQTSALKKAAQSGNPAQVLGAAIGTGAKAIAGSFKKGGKVKRTGDYKLHSGERVLNRKQTKKYDSGRKRVGKKA